MQEVSRLSQMKPEKLFRRMHPLSNFHWNQLWYFMLGVINQSDVLMTSCSYDCEVDMLTDIKNKDEREVDC